VVRLRTIFLGFGSAGAADAPAASSGTGSAPGSVPGGGASAVLAVAGYLLLDFAPRFGFGGSGDGAAAPAAAWAFC
jgi:hypothetical protein